MPYISQAERDGIDPAIYLLVRALQHQCGEPSSMAGGLNYTITRLFLETLLAAPRYSKIALATGVLENVKQEMYRRLAAPYENKKAEENGDVYS